ncbi:hypothetical protein D9756_010517 [Leucocoprinus leucothites]|uniref:G domain-containing protein n=1 Tax=Leucocoprinus leucothites TaxID=201217 RepID=A0A8H5CUQ8_9AGAR|nr:hypothetical protein D9756_010517 [Leucoagaricus leucothites]
MFIFPGGFSQRTSGRLPQESSTSEMSAKSSPEPHAQHSDPPNDFKHVMIVGHRGAGKSSLVNMLLDEERAGTSSNAQSHTKENTSYNLTVYQEHVALWDTVGLDLAPNPDAPSLLYVPNGQVSVVVFVLSKTITGVEEARKYWKPVQEATQETNLKNYGKKVPVILVVTGLENENPDSKENNLDGWWNKNGQLFRDQGITPDEFACVTAQRGKFQPQMGRHVNDPRYRASREKVLWLIAKCINGLEGQASIS